MCGRVGWAMSTVLRASSGDWSARLLMPFVDMPMSKRTCGVCFGDGRIEAKNSTFPVFVLNFVLKRGNDCNLSNGRHEGDDCFRNGEIQMDSFRPLNRFICLWAE